MSRLTKTLRSAERGRKGEVGANEPEICGKCKDRKVERKEAIIELVQTEINYGNDLQILKEVIDIS